MKSRNFEKVEKVGCSNKSLLIVMENKIEIFIINIERKCIIRNLLFVLFMTGKFLLIIKFESVK